MGRQFTYKNEIEYALEQMGYQRLVPYTTRKYQDSKRFKQTTYSKIESLHKDGKIATHQVHRGEIYAIPHPVGHSKYVVTTNAKMCIELKKIYKNQVKQVLIEPISNLNNSEQQLDLKLRNTLASKKLTQPLQLQSLDEQIAEHIADIRIPNKNNHMQQAIKIIISLDSISSR